MVRRIEGIAAPTTLAAQRPEARLFYDPKPIELYDTIRVLTHYGTKSGTDEFDPRLDLEPDGRISLADLPRVLWAALGF